MNPNVEINTQKLHTSYNLNIERIIQRWVESVREEIPAAYGLTDDVIINGLKDFLRTLDEMIVSLDYSSAQNGQKAEIKNITSCQTHGQARAAIPTYTLDQVINEYRILRTIVLDILEENSPMPKNVRGKLLVAIDNGLVAAATEFALMRGFADARLSEAIIEKNKVKNALQEASIQIENLGIESKARENFVSALSHDLRNPLSAARLNTQLLLRDTALAPQSKKLVNAILVNIERTDQMIRDLLDVSRIKSGRPIPLNRQHIELTMWLDKIVKDLTAMYGQRFTFIYDGPINVYLDPQGIRRIVENLVTNAIKYGSPEAMITVRLGVSHGEVEISVHNEGNPIPKADQEAIFNQFQRTKKTQEEFHQSGWGIGLALVRGIAEAHGGRVSVHSSQAAGTTFEVTLPHQFAG